MKKCNIKSTNTLLCNIILNELGDNYKEIIDIYSKINK